MSGQPVTIDPSRPLVCPGRPHDPINKFWTIVGHTGAVDVAQCNFCGIERSRIPNLLKAHLSDKCNGAPDHVKRLFSTPESRIIRGPYKKTIEKMKETQLMYDKIKRKREKKRRFMEEEGKPKQFKSDLHPNQRLTREEMDQQEHRARMSLMKSETAFLDTKEKMCRMVGCSLSGFLSSADFLMKHLRETGWTGGPVPGERYD